MPEQPKFATALDLASAEALMSKLGEPHYRATQLLKQIYKHHASSFEEMTNFSKPLRQKLASELAITSTTEVIRQEAKDGTIKALLELYDRKTIETVLMPSSKEGGFTVCVSSQVGCPVCCPFCATGQQGFERNLSAAEIIDQVIYFARYLDGRGHISNIVFMGMGEPLANYASLMAAIGRLNAPWGLGLGARSMTISTAGMVPGIEKLAHGEKQLGLAVSLHAAEDSLRSELVPLNRKYPLTVLMPAIKDYINLTGRRVSFEYCLFEGINSSLEQARKLAHLVKGMNAHVNLIAANPSRACETKYHAPKSEAVKAFEAELRRLGINATLRRSYGQEIKAACGQLKSTAGK